MYAGHLSGAAEEITECTSGFLRAQGSGARLFALLEREGGGAGRGEGEGRKMLTLQEGYTPKIEFRDISFR